MNPESGARVVPRLRMLLEAVLNVGSDLDLRATLQHIVDTATELAGARYGALGVVDPERGTITELYTSGADDGARERIGRLPDGHTGLIGHLVQEPQPLLVPDLSADPRAAGLPPGHPAMRSFVGVPIRVHTENTDGTEATEATETFGTLYLTEKQGAAGFTTDDLALLRVLASQAGIAIGNARLYETARRRERWIEGAAACTTALLTGESAEDALMTVAEQARILADASAGVVLQPTAGGGMEIVAASTLDDPADLLGTAIEPGSPVLEQLLGGEPVFVEDSATDERMTTRVRGRFGPSMMLPLQSGGRLIGTLALPRRRGGPAYTAADRLLASQFASQAALALVLADSGHDRERLAVFEDRDRIARDLHDLVVQRLFATEMMLESTRRRAGASTGTSTGASTGTPADTPADMDELLGAAVDELDSTIQEVRTTIFALQQPPADAPATFRGRVLRETAGAATLLGFQPSVHFTGAVDALVREPVDRQLLTALRGALAAAHRRAGITAVGVEIDATVRLADGQEGQDRQNGQDGQDGQDGVRLTVTDDGTAENGRRGTTVSWQAPL